MLAGWRLSVFAGNRMTWLAMREATGLWIEEVILPLRTTRERWKSDAEKQSQRQQILRLEVEAERYLAELMWANTDHSG